MRGPPSNRRLFPLLAVLGGLVLLTIAVVAILASGGPSSPGAGWVRAGTVDQVRSARVIYLADAKAFVVSTPSGPTALSAISPHLGELILFCPSSGWFEEPRHGEKFDRNGDYALGPAPRGMDHVAIEVEGNEVWIDPAMVIQGSQRGHPKAQPPSGPFCQGQGSAPGFAH